MSEKIKFSDLFKRVVNLLENAKIGYLLIGGVAVGVWGKPRVTEDIDFIIFSSKNDIKRIKKVAENLGLEFKEIQHPQIPKTFLYRIHKGLYHADFIIASTDFEKTAFQRRVRVKIYGKDVYVPTKEDLILLKVIPGRGIDIFDAENIVIRNKGKLDEEYLMKWSQKLSDEAEDLRIYNEIKRLLNLK